MPTETNFLNKNKIMDLAFDQLNLKLKTQADAHNALESKIGVLFAFVGAVAGGGMALALTHTSLSGHGWFFAGLIGLFVTMFLLLLASAPTTYFDPPKCEDLYSTEALAKECYSLKEQLVSNMIEGYKQNAKLQDKKAKWYAWSTYTFFGSMGLILISLFS